MATEVAQENETPSHARLYWALLFLCFVIFVSAFGIVQPPTGPGDEGAHMQYVKFLADEHRLPVWESKTGGEAGYESQHPPLYYAATAVVYSLASGLTENWRWLLLRFFSIAIGVALFFVTRKFSLEYFNGRFVPAYTATAAFMLTPTVMLHGSYVNVDIASALFSSVVLLLAVKVARGKANGRDRILLSAAFGAGMLTKMTAIGLLPLIITAHFLDPNVDKGKAREQRLVRLLQTLLGVVIIAGWYFIRNNMLYGKPFVHTQGRFGSGWMLATNSDAGLSLLKNTLRETYVSTWVQRGWLSPGVIELTLLGVLTALVLAAFLRGILRRSKGAAFDPAPLLCVVLLLSLFIGQQIQVWFSDYEFNAGGRYILNGLMGIQVLIVSGLYALRARRIALPLWIGVFLAMNILSLHRITTHLNPTHYPGWHIFEIPEETPAELFPLGEEL